MAIRRRPPVYVVAKRPLSPRIPLTFHVWACDARLQAARFQYRRDPGLEAILHRSTKKAGGWQVTYLRNGVPTGDFQEASCDKALRELPPKQWRLRKLTPPR
jgi:hypothetical protein